MVAKWWYPPIRTFLLSPITFPIPILSANTSLLHRLWLWLPRRLRLCIYYIFGRLHQRFTSKKTFLPPTIHKLGLGLYLKWWFSVKDAEAHAMWLVQQHTKVPSPKLLDYLVLSTPWGDCRFILMAEIHGSLFREVETTLTAEQIEGIGTELRGHIEAIRSIPNPYTKQICSASGGEIYSPYFDRNEDIPACEDVAAFHRWIRENNGQFWPQTKSMLEQTFERFDNTKPVFAHGDLADHNILIRDGKLAGVIDWETAGWMPIYWEYVCAMNYDEHKPLSFHQMHKVALPDAYDNEVDGILTTGMIRSGLGVTDYKFDRERFLRPQK